ncbi:MAG: hypothetical protein JWN56_1568 [Sphingobacteriales bacterium]|nr:hypothetical protein [Sphingobacteriales bacterium]
MEREEFLSKFGLGLAAVCVGGCFAACGKSDSGTPTPIVTPPAGAKLTANLDTELTTIGETKTGNGIILVRLAAGNDLNSFTAVQRACTHEGANINYNVAQGKFICPSHFSEFSTTGAVLQSPALTSLRKYTIAISGSTLTVTV